MITATTPEPTSQQLALAFEENVRKLRAFKGQYGHYRIPKDWPQDKHLAQWVENICKAKDRLPKKWVERLLNLGFDFSPPSASSWEQHLEQLKAFYKKHGHTYVPKKGNEELYEWTKQQRPAKALLTREQLKQLEELSFDWESKTYHDLRWEYMYGQLAQFQQQHGHCRVPYGSYGKPVPLATWIAHQRQIKDRLPADRLQKLNGIGFLWQEDVSQHKQDLWELSYQRLLRVHQQYGQCLMPLEEPYDKVLDSWVRAQQKLANRLPKDRRQKLESIGFPWQQSIWQPEQRLRQALEQKWEEKYAELKAFYNQHGHCRVPFDTPVHRLLSKWMSRQRKKKDLLSQEQQQRLNALQFRWQDKWETGYQALAAFHKKHGHCMVTAKHIKLRTWVFFQRQQEKLGKLPFDRKQRLTALGFMWRDDYRAYWQQVWEQHYIQLVAFKQQHGHCGVPYGYKQNKRLALWVSHQRLKWERIPEYRKEKLLALGFIQFAVGEV